ncbi:MAG: class I SAM-dependent methyltransferase [Longimicrobiaceae bacterium]
MEESPEANNLSPGIGGEVASLSEPERGPTHGSFSIEMRLRRRFKVRIERFEHEGLELGMLLPVSPEELIDEAEFERDERLPYWAELWPSARALTRHLLEREPPPGRVLELGAGVALPSLALHARGAQVLATDYYEDALLFARANAEHNDLPPLPAALLDWRQPAEGLGRFDLILSADVLYERRNAEALAAVLPRLLTPAGRVLLADPGRVYLDEFERLMVGAGWSIVKREVREEISDPATGRTSRVRILELQQDMPLARTQGRGRG